MENEEIDLIEVIAKLWQRKKTIAWFVVGFVIMGTALSFLLPRKYTAECTLGLETEDRTTRISVEGMSAFQNMNMADVRNTKIVTPAMYPDILFSVPFQKELIYTPLLINPKGEFISFYEYYIPEEDRSEGGPQVVNVTDVEQLTRNEEKCLGLLKKAITAKIENKEGYLRISVDMPNPYVAAQMVHQIQVMLQKYISKFRIAKAQAGLEFIEERYMEVKKELEAKQLALLTFREKAKNKTSLEIQTEEKILTNDYELYFQLYSDITKQLEKAKIQVKENMPVLTVIEPVVVPTRPSQPKKLLIVLSSLFLGIFVGCGWVLAQPAFARISKNKVV